MDEKIYIFMLSHDASCDCVGSDMYKITVKQSELVQYQKDLLLAEAIKAYDNLTDELQMRFVQEINKR